jgi:hypothetical protein
MGSLALADDVIPEMIQNYVTHMTRIKDPSVIDQLKLFAKQTAGNKKRLVSTARGKERFLPTIEDLETFIRQNQLEGKLELVSTRADDTLVANLKALSQAMLRKRSFNQLASLQEAGKPLVTFGKKGPSGYETITGNILEGTVWVHPKTHRWLQSVWGDMQVIDDKWGRKVVKALDYVESFGKGLLIRLSAFHYTSMTLGLGQAVGFGVKSVKQAGGSVVHMMRNVLGVTKRAVTAGLDEGIITAQENALTVVEQLVTKNPELGAGIVNMTDFTRRYILSGGEMKPAEIGAFHILQRGLRGAEQWLKSHNLHPLAEIVTGARKYNQLADLNMWSYYHTGSKFIGWAVLRSKFISETPEIMNDAVKLRELEFDIMRFMSNATGGQAWNLLGITPFWQRFMRRSVMYPDWNASQIRSATDFLANMPGFRESVPFGRALSDLISPDVMVRDTRFKLARQFALNSAVYFFATSALLNKAFTGRWVWENSEDAWDDIGDMGVKIPRVELPFRDSEGRKQYMDIAKQLAEPLEFMFAPGEFLKRKMGFLPRIGSIAVLGFNPSFDRPVYGFSDGPLEKDMKKVKAVASHFLPISIQNMSRVAAGEMDLRSALLSTGGFPVRPEPKEAFKRRNTIAEMEALLKR